MSTNRRIYLDHNATSPLGDAARTAMIEAMTEVGNPSSIHAEGRRMRDLVERARGEVAGLLCRPREQIVFTSGGTEANQLGVLALAAVAERRGRPRVVAAAAIDHPSLRGAVAALGQRGWRVLGLDAVGAPGELGLVALGAVNHELGTIEPLARTASELARHGVLVHVDAVQAAGKLPLAAFAGDAIAVSAHKLGGPQGVGALAIALDDALPLGDPTAPPFGGAAGRGQAPAVDRTAPPFGGAAGRGQAPAVDRTAPPFGGAAGRGQAPAVDRTAPPFGGAAGRGQAPAVDRTAPPFGGAAGRGQAPAVDRTAPPFGGAAGRGQAPAVEAGHQERGRRPGTENVLGIVGFGAAAAAADVADWPRVAALGARLEAGLLAIASTRIHGADRERVGGTINAAFAGARGESIVIALDLAGIAVSTGAACTSGSVQPSPVLLALGEPPERAREAVRFSLGRSTTADEIDEVLRVLPGIVARARAHPA